MKHHTMTTNQGFAMAAYEQRTAAFYAREARAAHTEERAEFQRYAASHAARAREFYASGVAEFEEKALREAGAMSAEVEAAEAVDRMVWEARMAACRAELRGER